MKYHLASPRWFGLLALITLASQLEAARAQESLPPAPEATEPAPFPGPAATSDPAAPAGLVQPAPAPAQPAPASTPVTPGQVLPAPAAPPAAYQVPPGYVLVPAPAVEDHALTLERAREYQIMQLNLRRNALLASNRRWVPPAITLALGVSSLIAGGVLFHSAWNGGTVRSCNQWGCEHHSTYNEAKDRAGLVLMPVGAALTIVSTVMLVIRLSRRGRLHRAEQQIQELGGQLTLKSGLPRAAFAGNGALLRW